MTRRTKTPRERAEETLGIAQRRVDRARTALEKASAAQLAAEAELRDARARLTYAQQDPALANPATSTTDRTSGGTTA